MSNKTVLQELIDKLESELHELDNKCDISEINDGVRFAYNHILTLIDDGILEKEKQQIMEAFKKGVTSCYDFKTSEEYFNDKYGNPQGDPGTTK
ncbi:hypothetical protein [Elizabethkingia anophelis]|uniref:hypothetical protein n=1 Tax=Elizabethkingia anophelis TaxID=1117645 RepID=UPI000751854E|nr:hypothetical protein [Elizabethkingia anophelis]AQW91323.1 hypothetical protein BBD28_11945 [Elizabethkingia anophelis]KUY14189.1 hypothetical protein ATB94_09325 [Elizabethkingia anophelis]